MGACVSGEVRVRTSQPAAEMLKGTSLLRKKTKTKTKNPGRKRGTGTSLPAGKAWLLHTAVWHAHSHGPLLGPPWGPAEPTSARPACPPRGAALLRDMPAFPSHLPGPQGLHSTNSSQAPAHLVQLPAFPMAGLSPIWPEAQFLHHPLSRTQQETRASRGSFPYKLLPEAPPDPGPISSDPSVL